MQKKGDCYEAFALEQDAESFEEINRLFEEHNTKLKKKGVLLYLLAKESLRAPFEKIYGKRFLKEKFQLKYTTQTIISGMTIYQDTVATHALEEGRPVTFVIRSKNIAQMYRNIFYDIWGRAKQ